ncbi:hypothetical protein BT96DRAFT_278317 [Gymnopus androsaceus JB14]|uniref:Uncharacterized protein n=1 Tax=Gymnopus androsaceus JB14 TaxID=1447944 RepID=A0A6A4H212_9AGAR|nr:hypothetical protein BT96DRAFT_278317 [Gymnopus androsaceus JB14]
MSIHFAINNVSESALWMPSNHFHCQCNPVYCGVTRYFMCKQGSWCFCKDLQLLKFAKNAHIIPTSSIFTANGVPWPNL